MTRSLIGRKRSDHEDGAAPVLLLFAMSAFSVLGIAAMTTDLRGAPPDTTYEVMASVREGDLRKFIAQLAVPNAWRLQGGNGSYFFQLPVLVPDNASEDSASTGAWHAMSDIDVPGLSVCCESRQGVCSTRSSSGDVPVDWTPGAEDAQWLSVDLDSQAAASGKSELVTATLLGGPRDIAPHLTTVSCQLELQGAVLARGFAYLRQAPGQDGLTPVSDVVQGTMDIAIRTR